MSATPTSTSTPSPTTPSSATPSTPSTTTSTLSTITTTSSPSINAATTAASNTSSSSATSTSTASTYQIPNMNVYIPKSTCRDLSIIHHANTETNVHPATLLARVNLNEAQLFYLRSHSAAYPIVTTLYALPQEDWFECRIYPYPNGIPPMMIPPPPLPAITGSATTQQPSTGAATPSVAPAPSPLVPSASMCSLFMGGAPSPSPYYDYGYTNSPTAKFHKSMGLNSPLPMVSNMYDNWNLRRSNSQISLQSPGTPTPSSLSTLSTLNSSPSLNAFPSFMQHEVVSAAALAQQGTFTHQHPYTSQFLPSSTAPSPSTSNPAAVNHNINIQHIQYQMRAPTATTPTTKNEPIIDSTKLSRKRKVSMDKEPKQKKKNKITKRTTRSSTRSKNMDDEEEEEEEVQSEPSTPSSPADEFEEVDEPDATGDHSMESLLKRRKSTELENSRRKKVLKKVYKKRYQQKKSIKRKIARFHTTGDKAVVIFVTRNSQRKYGFDVEFYNPTSSTNDFMNKFWREQQPLVESYIQQHFSKHKTDMELPDPTPTNKHTSTTTTHHIQPQPTYPTSSPSSSSLPVLEFIGTHPPSMSAVAQASHKLYPHHTSQTSQIITMSTPHLESPPHTIEAAA